jgi:uncharacterized protein (TIGR00661 family)
MSLQKRILVCPLDWGLGHATRCIPIIRLLLQKNAEVIIAGEGVSLELLKKEFPQLQYIVFKGYSIFYPDKGDMILKMMFSVPGIISGIIKEHRSLKKIISQYKIDIVISDNRYGLWNNNVKSIFITHQLMIKTPFAEKLLHRIVLNFVKKYHECWVPDTKGTDNLSGDLSHKYPLIDNIFFVETLSRFEADKNNSTINYDVLAIVSGPEPQRSIFEKLLIGQLKQNKLKSLLVCGKPQLNQHRQTINDFEIVSHLTAAELQKAILRSKMIIARSGYSTIMDLAVLGKKAVLVPTPGQTEQEYLADKFMQDKIAFTQSQSTFNLQQAVIESDNYKGFRDYEKNNLLEKRIDNLLK